MSKRSDALEFHDVASIFPLIDGQEFEVLKSDIQANGQREPIWLHKGKIVDGRNRYRACRDLGVEPKTREWDGKGSLVEFVVSLNLHRRHLSSSQRAAVGVEIEERLAAEAKERQRAAGERGKEGGRPPKNPCGNVATRVSGSEIVSSKSKTEPAPKARDQAAKIVGSSPRYIQDAKAVAKAAPDLHEKVKAGALTLPQAKREVQRAEKRAALEAKAAAVATKPEPAPTLEIVEGDCIAGMEAMAPGSARLVFADPPYNIGVDYGPHHDDRMADEDFIDWSQKWVDAAARLLTDDGSMWVLIGDEYADFFGVMLRDAGLHRRAWLKWYESFGVNCANNFNRCSRHLFYCVKDPKRFVFNADAVSRPSDRQAKYGDKRADPGGKIWDDVWGINPPIPRLVGNAAERIPDFPTQLPTQLLLAVVGCASEPGDLVVDPFSGSGTTGEACLRLGRRFRGFELSAEFARLSRMRLRAAQGGSSGKVA